MIRTPRNKKAHDPAQTTGFAPTAQRFSSTPCITGSKKQSEERAALFAVRVYAIVIF